MGDPCGISDLGQLVSGGNGHFPLSTFPQIVPQLFSGQQNFAQPGEDSHNQYHLMGMTDHCLITNMLPEFNSDCATATRSASTGAGATSLSNGFEVETACDGGDAPGCARWPKQETLVLLEIRSLLDDKFRDANQKGPLWDEVSRFMSEEHGYQRSGKKCREKFENLYKYYKKTKEGKAGRQDGNHYRFFRQLDALYGETKNAVALSQTHGPETRTSYLHDNGVIRAQKANQEAFSISLSNCSDFNSTSSDEKRIFTVGLADSDVYGEKRRKRRERSWGEKIKEVIDFQVRKMMEKQEVWLDRLMKTLEQKEKERMVREDEWRKQEVLRIEREHKIWAKERERIEARDAALMAALGKLTGRELENSLQMAKNGDEGGPACRRPKEICKKRKEKSSLFGNVNGYSPCIVGGECNSRNSDHGLGESSSQQANKESSLCISINGVQGSCLKFLMNEGEPLLENYGLKLNNGDIIQ